MLQYLSWAANVALFVGSCALTADIANAFFSAALTPDPATLSQEAVTPVPLAKRDWSDREAILARNLFQSGTTAATLPPPVVESEELEATKLPLALLGTAAATDDFYSWAAIEDRESRKTKVVRIGDEIRPTATVMRIERRRVVLDENGLPRELALKGGGPSGKVSPRPSSELRNPRTPRRRSRTSSSRRPPAPGSLRKVGDGRFELPRSDLNATLSNPSTFLNQARFMPKFEGGEMVGLQVNDPRPGSMFQQAGIQNGDVITEINGVAIDSAEQSRNVLSAFEEEDEIDVVVMKPDGQRNHLTIDIPQL